MFHATQLDEVLVVPDFENKKKENKHPTTKLYSKFYGRNNYARNMQALAKRISKFVGITFC